MTKILLIDDEEPVRKILSLSLRSDGYEVTTAEDGERGLELFQKINPSIVITDIKMPGIDGIEILKRIKNIDPEAEVIVITGHGDMDLAIESLQLEASDFITKPINDKGLSVALKRAEEKLAIRRKLKNNTAKLISTNQKLIKTVNKLEQLNREILLLNKLSELLQSCDSEEETYNIMITICQQLFPLDSGYLTLLDNSHELLKIVASWGKNTSDYTEFPYNQCWSIRRGKVHFTSNNSNNPVCPHINGIPNYGCLCIPMNARGEVLGMIHICLGLEDSPRSDKELENIVESKQMLATNVSERYAPCLVNIRLRENLRLLSIQDPLTGLYNRRYIEESLKHEMRRAKRLGTTLGIIMFDIDHFKVFNDSYGHEVGDVVLKELGTFLQLYTKEENIACRFGGEEFIIIIPETSLIKATNQAEELRKSIKKDLRIKHKDKLYKITMSLGVALFPEHGSTANETICAADNALYQAKAKGRDQVAVASLPNNCLSSS